MIEPSRPSISGIARRVTAALHASDEAVENRTAAEDNTTSIEAYTLYLKGRSLLDERLERRGAAVSEALESFRSAVRIDASFVRAHVGIASASFLMPSYDETVDREEWLERAEAILKLRSLKISGDLAAYLKFHFEQEHKRHYPGPPIPGVASEAA